MIGWLVVVVLVVTAALAVFGIGITIAGRPPGRELRFAVFGTVALLVVQAVVAVVRLFSGPPLPENSTFLIYLVVSVLVLPIALQFATASDDAEGPPPAPHEFLATGDPEPFRRLGRRFLGPEIGAVAGLGVPAG